MNASTRLFVSLFFACVAPLSAQTSLNFNLGGPGETIRDQFVFADGGVTATATAFSVDRTISGATLQDSQIVQWSPGIGVKNSSESITNVPYVPYYVDNQDHYDFVLFVFSGKVNVTSVKVSPSSGTFDLDASYWLGNIDTNSDLSGVSFADLSSLGFGSRIDNDSVASNSPRTFGITTPTGGVNAMLMGARIGGDANHDRFKISTVQGIAVIPEPSTTGLLICSLALALRRRRQQLLRQLAFEYLPHVRRDDLLALCSGMNPVRLVELFVATHSGEQVVHEHRLFLPGDFGEHGFKLSGEGQAKIFRHLHARHQHLDLRILRPRLVDDAREVFRHLPR